MPTTRWFRVAAKAGESYLWVEPDGEGRPELEPWTDSQGRDVDDVITKGDIDTLDFKVTFRPMASSRGHKLSDILWCGGGKYLPVTTRFIEALQSLGVAGWTTYDMTVVDRVGQPIPGYVGFIPDLTGTEELTSRLWHRRVPAYTLLATQRVADGLRSAGVAEIEVTPVEEQDRLPSGS